jgi:hypothetical protein
MLCRALYFSEDFFSQGAHSWGKPHELIPSTCGDKGYDRVTREQRRGDLCIGLDEGAQSSWAPPSVVHLKSNGWWPHRPRWERTEGQDGEAALGRAAAEATGSV